MQTGLPWDKVACVFFVEAPKKNPYLGICAKDIVCPPPRFFNIQQLRNALFILNLSTKNTKTMLSTNQKLFLLVACNPQSIHFHSFHGGFRKPTTLSPIIMEVENGYI